MSAALIWSNVIAYSLQIGLLVSVSALVPALLHMKVARFKLAYLQLVLAACLVMPGMRPWKSALVSGEVQVSSTITAVALGQNASRSVISLSEFALGLIALGTLARLGWLTAGLSRIRRYRRHSRPLDPPQAWPSWYPEAKLRLSDEIATPVTFGLLNPIILLPASFPDLECPMQEAILWHEMVHVRRRDWFFTVAEELVRAVFWFHPAIWWLLCEIQLAREQAVDRAVIEMTRSRDQYVDALLAIAGAPPKLDLAPAPLFLRKRHLKQRLISIFKEVRMSKMQSYSTLTAALVILAAASWFVTAAFPLAAEPQLIADSPGVSVETNGAQLIHRLPVNYPREAIAKGIEGIVAVQVKLDRQGSVSDLNVMSGPEELRKAALESVLNWHFSKNAALSTRQINIVFQLPSDERGKAAVIIAAAPPEHGTLIKPVNRSSLKPQVVKSISVRGLSDQARDELLSKLPVHGGDSMDADQHASLIQTVREFDAHLGVATTPVSETETAIVISPLESAPPPASLGEPLRIRVGGNVQSAKLITKVTPAYPPEAKAARIQGTVRFTAVIGKDGRIERLDPVMGEPILVEAAMAAVKQWIYQTTLLNGNPVDVVTQIDVNFTLSH